MSCGGFDSGLWPITWSVLIICITIYNLKKPEDK